MTHCEFTEQGCGQLSENGGKLNFRTTYHPFTPFYSYVTHPLLPSPDLWRPPIPHFIPQLDPDPWLHLFQLKNGQSRLPPKETNT